MTQVNVNKKLYLYMPNQRVAFDLGIVSGTGVIVGMSTTYAAIPGLGTIWIVKIDKPLDGYVYDCITVPSINLEPLEGM